MVLVLGMHPPYPSDIVQEKFTHPGEKGGQGSAGSAELHNYLYFNSLTVLTVVPTLC